MLSSRWPSVSSLAPGLLYALGLALAGFALRLIPTFELVSALLFAILLGILMRNLSLVPASAEAGLKYAARACLRAGLVLLGLRLALVDVLALGLGPLLVLTVTLVGVFLATLFLGRALRVGRATGVLLATGTAVCGASAVAGMASVVRPGRQEDKDAAVATALACITLCGTLAMFALPPLAGVLGLSERQTGVWIGAALQEVGQVVGAASFVGAEATEVATLTKLGRVVLLAPLVALVGFWEGRVQAADAGARPPLVPLFVLGFLGMMLLRSFFNLLGLDASLQPVYGVVEALSAFLLALAMGAMGTAVSLKKLVGQGLAALTLGLLASLVALGLSLVLVLLLV